MGSPLAVTVPAPLVADAWRIVEGVFGAAERDLTRFDRESALSRLNRAAGTGTLLPVTPLLARALAAAQRAYRLSDGLFDPRIVGALEAAGEHAGVALPPSPPHLLPGERWLRLDPRRLRAALAAPIDLGGIGKGLALRWAARALRRADIVSFLVEAGGDLVAGSPAPDDTWQVALRDPARRDPLAVLELRRPAAIATSSIALRQWRAADGTLGHHLIDPRTGAPAGTRLRAVTLAAADPAWAEVGTKLLLLRGSLELPADAPPAWLLTEDGRLLCSAAAASLTAWQPGCRSTPRSVSSQGVRAAAVSRVRPVPGGVAQW